jgi:hypothetical protein
MLPLLPSNSPDVSKRFNRVWEWVITRERAGMSQGPGSPPFASYPDLSKQTQYIRKNLPSYTVTQISREIWVTNMCEISHSV